MPQLLSKAQLCPIVTSSKAGSYRTVWHDLRFRLIMKRLQFFQPLLRVVMDEPGAPLLDLFIDSPLVKSVEPHKIQCWLITR